MTKEKHEYWVAELQDVYSMRVAERILAENLDDAMRQAEEMQVFQGTVLEIGDYAEEGYITHSLAIKEYNENWELTDEWKPYADAFMGIEC